MNEPRLGGKVHDGETFEDSLKRLRRNIRQPFNRHKESRGRIGWTDIPHAVKNVAVEGLRKWGLLK